MYVLIVTHRATGGPSEGDTAVQAFGPYGLFSDAMAHEDRLVDHYREAPHLYDGYPSETTTRITGLDSPPATG